MKNSSVSRQLILEVELTAGASGKQAVPIILIERVGSSVHVRPVRPGEQCCTGVWLDPEEEVVLRAEASHLFFENDPNPVRVVPEGRDGSDVFYRKLEPHEADAEALIEFVPSQDRLVQVTKVQAAGICFSSEAGRDDLLTAVRLVPDGREGNQVYARALRPDEPDSGEAVLLRSNDVLTLRTGSLFVSVEQIDQFMAGTAGGYAPVSNTIWTWLTFSAAQTSGAFLSILSAARRLDASHRMFEDVRSKLLELEKLDPLSVRARNLRFTVIGAVELAVISLHRAVVLASELVDAFGVTASIPLLVLEKQEHIKNIRDAYEHIEERARGMAFRKPNPDALSVFDFEKLFAEGVVVYGTSALGIHEETARIFLALREFLKVAVVEVAQMP